MRGIPGVGDGLLKKVREYFETGAWGEVEDVFTAQKTEEVDAIAKIHGLGTISALALHDRGFTSIQMLKDCDKRGRSPLTPI